MLHSNLLLVADESFSDPGGLLHLQPGQPGGAGPGRATTPAATRPPGSTPPATAPTSPAATAACTSCNIATPPAPVQLGVYSDPDPDAFGDARDVAVRGATPTSAAATSSIRSTSPIRPAPVLEYRGDLAASARRLAIAPAGQPWVAAGPAGVYQLEVGLFADGFESGNTSAWFSTVP